MTRPGDRGVAVVFGASSGIGHAAALLLSQQGYSVVLASRSQARLDQLAVRCQSAGAPITMAEAVDVTDTEAVDRLMIRAQSVGLVTVVVRTATVMAYGRMEDVEPAVFDQVVRVAIAGTLNVARSSLKIFRRQKRVISSSSTPFWAPSWLRRWVPTRWPSGVRPR